MKLKNPDLRTSFKFCPNVDRTRFIHSRRLQVLCNYCKETDSFYYSIYAYTFELDYLPLLLYFDTLEEAFACVDKICTLYPRIETDSDNYYDDFYLYPEYNEEDVKNDQ